MEEVRWWQYQSPPYLYCTVRHLPNYCASLWVSYKHNSVLLTELRVCGSTHSMWILCSTVRQDCSLMLISAILCIAPPQSLRNLILRRADVWRGEDVEGHYMESHIAPCCATNHLYFSVCVCVWLTCSCSILAEAVLCVCVATVWASDTGGPLPLSPAEIRGDKGGIIKKGMKSSHNLNSNPNPTLTEWETWLEQKNPLSSTLE